MSGAIPGPDGLPRCPWGISTADYLAYHDHEWGRPVRDDTGLFERLSLEAFQSGLSWLTILRKRENFRAAFSGFDIGRVAAFGPDDVARLLADTGIVRNRAKIEATIANARAALGLPGGLAAAVWSYSGSPGPAPVTLADIPSATTASKALSAQLRRQGFRFTGPVTVYAMMQACGVVNDHLVGCCRRDAIAEAVPPAPEAVPPAPEAVPPAPEAVPPAPEAVPPAPEAVPPAPEAVPPAPEAVPPAPAGRGLVGKPAADQLGVDLSSLEWHRSGTGEGSFEVAFVTTAGHSPAGSLAGSPGSPVGMVPVGMVPAGRGADWVLLRLAGDRERRILVYDRVEWECFLDGVHRGEFDGGLT